MKKTAAQLKAEFVQYDKQHPAVWRAFEQHALQLIADGHSRYSASTIVEHLRWSLPVDRKKGAFKINNNHVRFFAQRFLDRHPQHADFFERRGDAKPSPPPPRRESEDAPGQLSLF